MAAGALVSHARMLGRLGWHGQCACCNGPACDKRAEDRAWRREWDREQDEQYRETWKAHMWESRHLPPDAPLAPSGWASASSQGWLRRGGP